MNNEISKADRTRQFIIETTAGVFNTKGYAGTSIADLTDVTGLTKGSIYGNFANKEEVALAAFDYNLSLIQRATQQQMSQALSCQQKLLVYAQVYHSFNQKGFPVGGCPILNTATEADDTNNQLKEKAEKAVLAWKQTIVEIINTGMASGEFKAKVEPESTALAMIALIEGGIMIAKVTNNPASLNKILKTLEGLINQLVD
ncbi:TetR/AcrR family transcriptional regulator [Spirosoma pollinicola]|uniref:TetR/AcrR family transcriptional regulator n=1 Tax=Spirosoma pollinicola TaxID=2057025 RepID=A0A2K8Z6T4_9BACT|nr:TetR/AcrR family transcriptional regulator [Spirosoma pollinicola]AUD05582.1 TetR/AcrR family transcriptional regulator [Spirosoma pollinicola]